MYFYYLGKKETDYTLLGYGFTEYFAFLTHKTNNKKSK